MLGRFGRDAGSLLGVEIASDTIRMLQLRRQRGHWRVAAWACEPITRPMGHSQLPEALREAHRRCGTPQRRVALALPSSQVICKVCQLPAETARFDAEVRLLAQAEQLFPFPLDDLALDFQVLGVSAGSPAHIDVLVAACRQSQLDPLEHMFNQAGMQVAAMEVDSFALLRAMGVEAPADLALLQLEAGEIVLHGWQRDLVPLRQHLALDASGRWLESVERLWSLHGAQERVAQVMLAGGAADAERAGQLTDRLAVRCSLACPSPLAGSAVSESLVASMALACGLALGGEQA
ncbi:type IV pilus biogenesis protein PilM [Pseudomonas entomophila]|uniref:Pilus assembly protein PilM n=2 Tax=Pseudomonas entomophila TaxID=312306 RepID=A0ABY9QP82_9PSED|nr:pilus assembly protein PilM [Pseudomonas entomophila]WMW05863.1 pilus assembly protein PilM [Pseudomonas entomophila]CAK13290.1 putative type IV pili biogenesis protein PilM [Pseudomonas entomophila L48]